jgi:hypothetical protein
VSSANSLIRPYYADTESFTRLSATAGHASETQGGRRPSGNRSVPRAQIDSNITGTRTWLIIQKVPALKDLKIKIFLRRSRSRFIIEAYNKGVVKGFTTNPTLMAQAGITN